MSGAWRLNQTREVQESVDAVQRLWQLLTAHEKPDFWGAAVDYARGLDHGSLVYKRLCIALKAAESGKAPSRTGIALLRSARDLSTADLCRAISKYKDRLLSSEDAEPFLSGSLCRWVQATRCAPLIALLDAVRCPHDQNGGLKGEMPEVDPDEAREKACELAATYGANDVVIVCEALMLSNSRWNCLEGASEALRDLLQRTDVAPPPASPDSRVDEPATMTINDRNVHPPVGHALLNAIRDGLVELKAYLLSSAKEIDTGVIPDLAGAIHLHSGLHELYVSASTELQVYSPRIADLEAALELRDRQVRALANVGRCRSIVHRTEPSYPGVTEIRRKCDELEGAILANGPAPFSDQAVEALLRLIDEGESLGDEDAAQLQREIESFFGLAVAAAAVRGKLICGQETFFPATPPADSPAEPFAPLLAPQAACSGDDVAGRNGKVAVVPQPLDCDATGDTTPLEPTAAGQPEPEASPEVGTVQGDGLDDAFEDGADEREAVASSVDTASSIVEQVPGQDASEEPIPLRSEFVSFEEFCQTRWVNSAGHVAAAPWVGSDLHSSLAASCVEAWARGEMGLAYLFCRACASVGVAVPVSPEDLASADELLSAPDSPGAGRNPSRADWLRGKLVVPCAPDQTPVGIALILEALRPTLPCTLTHSEVELLLQGAAYGDPAVAEVIRFLFAGWAAELNPLDSLRTRLLREPQESVEDLRIALRHAQTALKTEVATLWSAAGGKIKHTHCRAAWTRFVEDEVAPLRDELAPSSQAASVQTKWTRARISVRVVEMSRAFKRIMDTGGVRHLDRSAAESAAQQIVAVIDRLAGILERLVAQQQRSNSYDGIPREAGMRLLAGTSSSTTDRLAAEMFSAVLHERTEAHPLRLPAGYLINHIDIVKYLNSDALTRRGIVLDGVDVASFEPPLPVAVLLAGWHQQQPAAVDDYDALLATLRDSAAASERRDILTALSGTDILQSHERTLLHRYALELQDGAFEAAKKLESVWGACNELMSPVEAKLAALVREARALTGVGSAANASITKNLLLHAWLRDAIQEAEGHQFAAANAILAAARNRSRDLAQRIQCFLEAEDYRSAVALFHTGDVPKAIADRLAGRRTLWRDDAVKEWPEPRAKLRNGFRGSNEDLTRLTDAWTADSLDTSQQDGLPRLFYAVISGEAGRTVSENQKRFPVRLADLRDNKERKSVISCETVRNYFQKAKLNPTFVPQLVEYSQIVIMTAPHRSSYGTSVLDDWSKAVTSETTGSLVVFLAPGIPPARRDDLSSGFRKRGIAAVIVDDVDLCRLYAASDVADGHDFIPFLEIILEQLDLDRASPFSSLDGQHVRLETYTGRTDEARKLALGGTYTRIFSGRKLGKSALLKFVANTYDGFQLASGNQLSVIFITIAGGESERWVVDCILKEMASRFSLQETADLQDPSPAERFSAYMQRFLSERPSHSVLLILDEADAFVEGQLALYDTTREGSLSFRMMKEVTSTVDTKQLPRIRTVFSGYRITDTRGGVWANAGDVLILRPLAEEDAVQFLQGMLARIGIALGNHAPFVAMRCGFQPAVLIRFGENLVRRLKRSSRSANRETLHVGHDEVLATLGESGVLDEIKTVVNNNFQGNRIGAVIFGATLLALKDLEPGLALTDGPVQVLAKLREIDPNIDWLQQFDASALGLIERNLHDFINRELLTVSEGAHFGVREYKLRFPHFLPVLTQQSEIALEVRQQIQAIRGGAFQRRLSECVLSESALETVRYWYHQKQTDLCKLVAVGGHWVSALIDRKCGLPDRLGSKCWVLDDVSPTTVSTLDAGGRRVFRAVTVAQWPVFLSGSAERPLVLIGGTDLQRTARRYALAGGDIPVETVTLGRLTEATLGWWFEEVRALHFKTGDAISRIAHATERVPYLAEAFDRLLVHAPDSDVTQNELEAVLSALEADLPNLGYKLGDQSSVDGLTSREVALLGMAVQVAEEGIDEFDLEREFPVLWEASGLSRAGEEPPLSIEDDWSSLKLLIDLGLLPQAAEAGTTADSGSLGRVHFNKGGTLVRLIKALEPADAA